MLFCDVTFPSIKQNIFIKCDTIVHYKIGRGIPLYVMSRNHQEIFIVTRVRLNICNREINICNVHINLYYWINISMCHVCFETYRYSIYIWPFVVPYLGEIIVSSRWFSPSPLVSSTNKTDRNDIAEILLKVG